MAPKVAKRRGTKRPVDEAVSASKKERTQAAVAVSADVHPTNRRPDAPRQNVRGSKRPTEDVEPQAKRERKDLEESLRTIVDALAEVPQLSDSSREMFRLMAHGSLATEPHERHAFQCAVVDMLGVVLERGETSLRSGVECASVHVSHTKSAQALVNAELSCANEVLFSRRRTIDVRVEHFRRDNLALQAARQTLDQATTAASVDLACRDAGDLKLAMETALCQNFAALNESSEAHHVEQLLALAKRVPFDQSLLVALPPAARRAPQERSTFDNTVLKLVQDEFRKHIADLGSKADTVAEGASERARSLIDAQQSLESARTQQATSASALQNAEMDEREAFGAVVRARSACRLAEDKVRQAEAEVAIAGSDLQRFQQGPMVVFRTLRGGTRSLSEEVAVSRESPEAAIVPPEVEGATSTSSSGQIDAGVVSQVCQTETLEASPTPQPVLPFLDPELEPEATDAKLVQETAEDAAGELQQLSSLDVVPAPRFDAQESRPGSSTELGTDQKIVQSGGKSSGPVCLPVRQELNHHGTAHTMNMQNIPVDKWEDLSGTTVFAAHPVEDSCKRRDESMDDTRGNSPFAQTLATQNESGALACVLNTSAHADAAGHTEEADHTVRTFAVTDSDPVKEFEGTPCSLSETAADETAPATHARASLADRRDMTQGEAPEVAGGVVTFQSTQLDTATEDKTMVEAFDVVQGIEEEHFGTAAVEQAPVSCCAFEEHSAMESESDVDALPASATVEATSQEVAIVETLEVAPTEDGTRVEAFGVTLGLASVREGTRDTEGASVAEQPGSAAVERENDPAVEGGSIADALPLPAAATVTSEDLFIADGTSVPARGAVSSEQLDSPTRDATMIEELLPATKEATSEKSSISEATDVTTGGAVTSKQGDSTTENGTRVEAFDVTLGLASVREGTRDEEEASEAEQPGSAAVEQEDEPPVEGGSIADALPLPAAATVTFAGVFIGEGTRVAAYGAASSEQLDSPRRNAAMVEALLPGTAEATSEVVSIAEATEVTACGVVSSEQMDSTTVKRTMIEALQLATAKATSVHQPSHNAGDRFGVDVAVPGTRVPSHSAHNNGARECRSTGSFGETADADALRGVRESFHESTTGTTVAPTTFASSRSAFTTHTLPDSNATQDNMDSCDIVASTDSSTHNAQCDSEIRVKEEMPCDANQPPVPENSCGQESNVEVADTPEQMTCHDISAETDGVVSSEVLVKKSPGPACASEVLHEGPSEEPDVSPSAGASREDSSAPSDQGNGRESVFRAFSRALLARCKSVSDPAAPLAAQTEAAEADGVSVLLNPQEQMQEFNMHKTCTANSVTPLPCTGWAKASVECETCPSASADGAARSGGS